MPGRNVSHFQNFHLLTRFDDDHKGAVVLQEAVVELDGVGEGVHVVDHLKRQQRHFQENLTYLAWRKKKKEVEVPESSG